MASSRGGSRSLPTAKASAASAAIVPARSTDGSARVSTTNQPITTIVPTRRSAGLARWSNGAAIERTRATFCPDTAVRWESPLWRKRAVIASGWSESSPMISPRARAASSPPSDDVAAVISARTRFDATSRRRPVDAVAEHVVIELADDVLPGDPAGTLRIERSAGALDPHEVTLPPRLDAEAGRPATHPHLEALVLDLAGGRGSRRTTGSGSAATVAHPA